MTTFRWARHLCLLLVLTLIGGTALGQSTATLQGTVQDASGAVIPGADIKVTNTATGLVRTAKTDTTGAFLFAAMPVGVYTVTVSAENMQATTVENLKLDVSRTVVQNFKVNPASVSQSVTITSEAPVVESGTITVGQVINQRTVQEVPLNGRHFVDLGLLIPGSVTPPQNGFLTAPLRGQGSFAFNTAGNREDTVNFMINGINLNDMVQNQITFQPSINTVSEFKVDNSTPSAEYGRNSGAIVNIATRSGVNQYHGEAFEFLRNQVLDARNFFDKTKPPFKRNQFGAAFGGPIIHDKTFFFFSYEGLRQRQGLTVNSGVLSAAQRATATDPAAAQLLKFIPAPNAAGANGQARFQGAATAPVNIDQWTGDIQHNLGDSDRLHGYYAFQRDRRQEPTLQGNTLPGFGDTRASHRQIFTLNESHVFSANTVNEARLGFNRIHITFSPNALMDPSALGINTGISGNAGLPQITISDIGLNFGGPAGFPQGRGDLTTVLADTLNWQHGRHAFHFGGEARRFNNNNFSGDLGRLTFSSVTNFLAGKASSFSITPGNNPSRVATTSIAGFVQDNFRWRPYLTLELGLRWDWNGTPVEAKDRFVNFDPTTGSLVRVHTPYEQNDKNFQPRVGFSWDMFHDGRTVMRGGYGLMTDQPVTNMVLGLPSNPPFSTPVSFAGPGTIGFSNLLTAAAAAGSLSPAMVEPKFRNAYIQSWNLNFQRELTPTLGMMIGYFGNKGTHLRVSINRDQPISGVKPFTAVSTSSAIAPGSRLGIISDVTSNGYSSYNGLWVSANKRMGHGLQFNTSYTWSHSIDSNSLSSAGIGVQNSYDLAAEKATSDYDVRHRFVINGIYDLPMKGNRLIEGWRVTSIFQAQTGNPLNILAGSNGAVNVGSLTGVATLRPDLIGPLAVIGTPTQWFTNSVCNPLVSCGAGAVFALPVSGTATNLHFGNLARNAVVGPGFWNLDFSLMKDTRITERLTHQFRVEAFDILNHTNFGQPGRIAQPGSTSFGVITNTRFPTGDAGSSRQLQFAMKLIF